MEKNIAKKDWIVHIAKETDYEHCYGYCFVRFDASSYGIVEVDLCTPGSEARLIYQANNLHTEEKRNAAFCELKEICDDLNRRSREDYADEIAAHTGVDNDK
jgi:hypothetical protein